MVFDNPDLSTNNISASAQWKHTVMANSFNDHYWQAAIQDDSATFPALSGFIDGTHSDADLVNRFKVMYDAVPPSVEVLATATN